ncbi:MAG: exonuclease domain-containing protein [Chloroflexota bacterium]
MSSQPGVSPPADRYAALAWRADAFLRARGGVASEAELVAELFGPTARGPVFSRLLAQVLADDPRFARAPDGSWVLPGRQAGARLVAESEFVILDLETTGLKPWRSGVHELAALRWREGAVVGTFAAVLNPGHRLPAYLASLTGLTPADLAGAPGLAAVADDLVAFLGDAVLVGHGLSADLSHLNRNLIAIDRPPLANPVLDTLELTERYWPTRGKPTLDRLARALDLPVGRRHRALPDAHLVAGVFRHLLGLATAAGALTLSDLGVVLPEDGLYALLDGSALVLVSEGPGVYLLLDATGQVIYVGKAANLQQRLGAYFSRPPAYVRSMEGLLESVADFQTVALGSELAALLEEARLIALHRPRFNVQLATHQRPAYLRFDEAAPCPRLTPVAAVGEDGARYFGPFRSQQELRLRQRHLENVFPFPVCKRQLPRPPKARRAQPCLRMEDGRCWAPCADTAEPSAYADLVAEFSRFLAGDVAATVARLQAQASAAGARGEQTTALRWQRLARLAGHGVELPEVGAGEGSFDRDLAVVVPELVAGGAQLFLLRAGGYAGDLRMAPDDDAEELAARLRAAAPLAEAAGRAEVLRRWALAHPNATVRLPASPDDDGWGQSAVAILGLADEIVNWGFEPDESVDDAEEDDE